MKGGKGIADMVRRTKPEKWSTLSRFGSGGLPTNRFRAGFHIRFVSLLSREKTKVNYPAVNIASLFSIEGPDVIVILLIVLLLYGARILPGQPRIGKIRRQFCRRLLTRVHCGFASAVGAPCPLFP